MKKKRITFGLLGLMICIILFALYIQLHNKSNIPVKASAIHPEEDRIFFIYSNPLIKESTLLSTSIKEHPLSDPFAFWYEGKGVSVKAYNVDTTGNEIHINDKKTKKEYQLTLPSLVTMGSSDENYIYIIQSMSIYVIDRKTEEMMKTLGLASYADKFVDSEEFIVASSQYELTVIEKGTWKTTYIPYPDDLEYADTVYYDKESGSFYVTYQDKEGKAHLLEYGKDFSFHTYA